MTKPKIVVSRRTEAPSKIQQFLKVFTFLPLTFLLLERLWIPFEGPISGYLNVESVASTTTSKLFATHETTPVALVAEKYPLQRIASYTTSGIFGSAFGSCPKRTQFLSNQITLKNGSPLSLTAVPENVHLAVDTNCASPDIYNWYQQWITSDGRWSTYVHDLHAQRRLLRLGAATLKKQFPQLPPIVKSCVPQDDALTTALWRYLVVYIYGGVHVSMEFAPEQALTLLDKNMDALVLMDQSNQEPGFFMASSGHPLLFLTLHHAMHDILAPSSNNMVTSALERAFVDFSTNVTTRDLSYGVLQMMTDGATVGISGMNNRTVTLVKRGSDAQYVKPWGATEVDTSQKWTQPVAPSLPLCRELILKDILNAKQGT
jgi:hypothetical protein